jgi:DNA-binding MarR family transcriptional regulator
MNVQVNAAPGRLLAMSSPKWLSPAELGSWMSFTLLLARLPAALEAQLQDDAGLSYVEYYVLAGLSDQPTGALRISQLAFLTNAEPSRMSHMVRRLERRGLVRREPDPCDGRGTVVSLTDAGAALLVSAAPRHVARVRELVVDTLDPDDLMRLGEISWRIVSHLDEVDPR